MAKFYGKIGFAKMTEVRPDVWKEVITEHDYYGDVLKLSRRLQSSEYLNDNITTNNQISIVADPFAVENFISIRYVKWLEVSWKVVNVDVERPRLILTLGGRYNGS